MAPPSSGKDSIVKVRFVLDREDEEWPPVRTEGVWARTVGQGEFELASVPWFARGAAFGDRVRAEPDSDGVLTVRDRVAWSGRYTIRVIPLGEGTSGEQVREIIDIFAPLGAECEGALPSFKIVALDIPPTARVAEIKALLRDGEAEGRWGYEEGCIDEHWAAL
jgi:hypothetical protein